MDYTSECGSFQTRNQLIYEVKVGLNYIHLVCDLLIVLFPLDTLLIDGALNLVRQTTTSSLSMVCLTFGSVPESWTPNVLPFTLAPI